MYKAITDDIYHSRAEQFLAEVVLCNRDPTLKSRKRIWSLPELKESYTGFLLLLKPRIETIGFDIIHKVIVNHCITKIDEQFDELVVQEILQRGQK